LRLLDSVRCCAGVVADPFLLNKGLTMKTSLFLIGLNYLLQLLGLPLLIVILGIAFAMMVGGHAAAGHVQNRAANGLATAFGHAILDLITGCFRAGRAVAVWWANRRTPRGARRVNPWWTGPVGSLLGAGFLWVIFYPWVPAGWVPASAGGSAWGIPVPRAPRGVVAPPPAPTGAVDFDAKELAKAWVHVLQYETTENRIWGITIRPPAQYSTPTVEKAMEILNSPTESASAGLPHLDASWSTRLNGFVQVTQRGTRQRGQMMKDFP
jgi:hypothetical protein